MPEIILIAGPSASGKTTLAKQVASSLGSDYLSLDNYYLPEETALVDTEKGRIRSFEQPHLYDGAHLAKHIEKHVNTGRGVVAEGFVLLAYPEIMALPAIRFYLEVSFATCRERRLKRFPRRRSDEAFKMIGESENARFVLPQRALPGVHSLDGTFSVEKLMSMVLNIVRP
jgi:uridine kinase